MAKLEDLDKSIIQSLHSPRSSWSNFPDVYILADEDAVRNHRSYIPAKTQADHQAGTDLLVSFLTKEHIQYLKSILSPNIILAAAHAVEGHSVNIIPHTYAAVIHSFLKTRFDTNIVQTNMVGHTRSNGWKRLANPALFSGRIKKGHEYFIIDDFVGMGGTLANLKGYIENEGGIVIGASVLTGKTYSAKVALDDKTLISLREKYDQVFEEWWKSIFGFGFEVLTESEARYLLRQTKGADYVRNSLLAEVRKRSGS